MAENGLSVTLAIVKGPEVGRVMEFQEPRGFLIGRARDADLKLPATDPYVSRHHVYLEICPPACRLRDIGTTNRALVNGKPFAECELSDGDIVEVGYTSLQVSIRTVAVPDVRPCRSCGRPITSLVGEATPLRCDDCRDADRIPHPGSLRPTRCFDCDTDLTERANSDGRAAELETVALYACERHLPYDKEAKGRIGSYEVCRQLGEGAMGVVYVVYHRPTARLLALKQIKDLQNPVLVKRFEREMRLLKGVSHPHVVRHVDAGIDAKGAPYLVTEYVAGRSLDEEVLTRGGQLPPKDAVEVICQVLKGLEHIHNLSIIHRDIKPQNVLLTASRPTGGSRRRLAKLADFGLAVSYARAGGTRVTKHGTALGTLMFMPPEQIRDAGSVREPADLYAVGVMLYYLLTGRYTFEFPTPAEVLELEKQNADVWKRPLEALRILMKLRNIRHPFWIILEKQPIPVRQRDASIPLPLAEVVDKAVRKEVGARFSSAADFGSALQRALR